MYETAAIRDLVWALQSPPMFLHRTAVRPDWGKLEVERNRGLLSRLDQPNSSLQRAVSRRSTNRLGEYFEILLRTWTDEIPPARLLGAGVQVNGSGGTVGEFDLLFARDGAVHHWELAVKYYLGYPGESGPVWYGPDPRDVLGEKWKKMRRQQLRLSQDPLGRQALRRLGIRDHVQPRAFVKGYLFEALNPNFRTHDHPHANPDASRGFWVHRVDLAEHRPRVPAGTRWLRLGRLRWMAPVVVSDDEQLFELDELVAQFPDEALFVAGVHEGEELARGFIVDDCWPK